MNNDLIADKIEEAIELMFSNFRSQEFAPTEYSIFYKPEKSSFWFIIIYFKDTHSLKSAIKKGLCYQIHSYLLHELNNVPETSTIDQSISFEFGNRPIDEFEYEQVIGQLIARMTTLQKDVGKTDIKKCSNCGHDFDAHQLMCNLIDDKATPTEGWIMCPEENCNCFQTWGANHKREERIPTSKLGLLVKKIFK